MEVQTQTQPSVVNCESVPVKKEKKPFVERIFYVEEKKRVITIAYSYDRENCVLSYGACIYRNDCDEINMSCVTDENNKKKIPKVPFCKKTHRETALNRLQKKPVIIPNIQDCGSIVDFHAKIRELVHRNGVCGKRL